MNILGLDLSTSVIGWSLIDENAILITFGYIKLPKDNKLSFAFDAIDFILKSNTINHVVIEDSFLGPNPKTFKELNKIRGVTELLLDINRIKHSAIMPSSARSKVFQSGKLKKVECFKLLSARYPNVNLFDKGYNISDSLVIALSKLS